MADFAQMEANAAKAVALLKVLGNQHRLMILCTLQAKEYSVSELNRVITIPQSTLSQHLAALRKEGLVKVRREAQHIYYTLNGDEATEVITVLHRLYCQ